MITDNFEKIILYLQKRRGEKHIRLDEYPDVKVLFCEYGQFRIWIGQKPNGQTYDVDVQNTWLADDQGTYGVQCTSQEQVILFIKLKVRNVKTDQ